MVERVEVVDVRRRRRWSVEDKLRILAECDEPGACPADVARRYDLSTGLLYPWRRMAEERASRAARMKIGLPGGIRLKVDAGVDPEALAAVVAVLQRR